MNALSVTPVKSNAVRIRSARFWSELFRENLKRDWQIPWKSGVRLSGAERRRIGASIGDFQRGESSEARTYLAKSQEFAVRIGDTAFHEASVLFIREENRHAELLLGFMQETGILQRGAFLTDGIFRWLRGLSDIGWTSRVILVAELIAQEYYPCLRAATGHPALGRICDKVISDEAAHIRFQVERITRVEAGLGRGEVGVRDAVQAVLLVGTVGVVWLGHGRVLRCRMRFGMFLRRVMARNRRAAAIMKALRRISDL